jgi:hypothetical protein
VSCYTDIIRIRAICGEQTTPHSGWYLEDLPGFDQSLLDVVLTKHDHSALTLGEEILERAWKITEQELLVLMAPNLKLTSIMSSGTVGDYDVKNRTTFAPTAGREYGVVIEVTRNQDFDILLQEVSLLLDTAQNTTITVYDLLTGQTVTSFTINAQADVVTRANPYYTISTEGHKGMFFVAYPATATSYAVKVQDGCSSCKSGDLKFFPGYIATADAKTYANFNTESYSPGLVVDYSLKCSYTQWMCRNARIMALPVLYRAGMELLDEILYNRITVASAIGIDRDKSVTQKDDLKAKYTECLKGIEATMKYPCDVCFNCNQRHITRQDV